VVRFDGAVGGVHEHEAAGAVGVLGHAAGVAGLAEQRRLLVASNAGDLDSVEPRRAAHFAVHLARGANLGQHRPRHAEAFEQLIIPFAGADVQEQRPRSVRGVREMEPAGGELVDQPAVDRPASEPAGLGRVARAGHMIENPGDLGGAEIRIEPQAGLEADQRFAPLSTELVADAGGAAVLPDDRRVNRHAGRAIPDDHGLALVGDADRRHVGRLELGGSQRFLGHGQLRRPDLLRIVLDPTGLGKRLAKLPLGQGHDVARLGEHNGAGRSRALIEGQDIFHGQRYSTPIDEMPCGRHVYRLV
jgi:hypothetical protein